MKIEQIRIGDLTLNEKNIRKNLNVDDLIDSISESGVLVPLIVTPDYIVVDGNRRLEAARQVFGDNAMITVEIKDLSEQEIIEYSLITALQREDLTEKEKATAYQQLSMSGLSDLAIAKKIGKKKTDVKAYVKAADVNEEAWESHSLEELQYIAEYPELAKFEGKALTDGYDRLVAKTKFENWLKDFNLPENTEFSETEKWYDNKGYGFDGLVIKSDGKVYHDGEVIAENYKEHSYADETLIQVVANELWIIEPKDMSINSTTNEAEQAIDIIEDNESELYEEYLEIWSGIVERTHRKIEESTIIKEPALSLVNVICSAYGFNNLKDMAHEAFDSLAIEPFYMRNGKLEHRECECLDFINAMTVLSDSEKEVVYGGE